MAKTFDGVEMTKGLRIWYVDFNGRYYPEPYICSGKNLIDRGGLSFSTKKLCRDACDMINRKKQTPT